MILNWEFTALKLRGRMRSIFEQEVCFHGEPSRKVTLQKDRLYLTYRSGYSDGITQSGSQTENEVEALGI